MLFFLLFHFGDMTNCLADRELDAVYKTHLSEAVFGLGVARVKRQIVITAAAALALGGYFSRATGRWDVLLLVVFGLGLGAAYSFEPVRLKRRGVVQILALWSVIFVGPMLLVARALEPHLFVSLAVFAASYGAMQQGTILVNTAEDLPEDAGAGVRTSAVALGLERTLLLALAMVALGGFGVFAILAAMFARAGASPWGLVPLGVAVAWVTWELVATFADTRGKQADRAISALRPHARRMPAWITATAWGTLAAAFVVRATVGGSDERRRGEPSNDV